MSAFEFFFSFFGLVLGLSVAVIATGLATAIQHRKAIRIGWLTPLLAVFVALDIASFWEAAWTNFRQLEFSYGLLIVGLAIALVYFIAASLVFPHQIEDGMSLDDHFWANRRLILLLTTLANTALVVSSVLAYLAEPAFLAIAISFGFNLLLYLALTLPAAFVRKASTFAVLVLLHIGIYLTIAVFSILSPNSTEKTIEAMRQTYAQAQAAQADKAGK